MRVLAGAALFVLVVSGTAFADTTHVVQQGETLWSIASTHGVSVEAIARANGLSNPDLLRLGQRLLIPTPGARPVQGAAAESRYTTYRIQAGDTLWELARRFRLTVEELAALNGIDPEATLHLGQTLRVKAQPVPAASHPAPTAPRPRTPPAPEYVRHTVRPGDTLWALAQRYNMSVQEIARLNDIAVDATLQPGQALKVRALPSAATAPQAPAVRRVGTVPYRGQAWATSLIGLARRFMGVRYRWGATGPNAFDCSGFLQYVYSRMGVSLPRTTYYMYQAGRPVPAGELQPGDMVFFTTYRRGPSHAGIYIGNGSFIHSSSGYGSVTITPLSKEYYRKRYLGARRF